MTAGPPATGVASALGGWAAAVVLVAVPAWAYLAAVRHLATMGRRWSRWRSAAFLGGLVLVAAAMSPPVAETARDTFRGHVVGHLLLGMWAPVGLVLGAPVTLLLATLPGPGRRRVRAVLARPATRVVTHPATAAVLDVGGLFVLYLTGLHALSLTSDAVHHLVHLHVLLAGTLFAWSIAGPDPAPGRPPVGVRAVVLVGATAGHAVLSKLLFARATTLPVGTAYAPADVETAARWMYHGGDVAEVALAVALFSAWYRRRGRIRIRPRAAATATATGDGDVGPTVVGSAP